MLKIADTDTIKNPKGIITEVQESIAFWQQKANELGIHAAIIQSVEKGFKVFVD
jgi:hypothetical protein